MSIAIDGGEWKDNKWKFDYTKVIKPLIEETKDKKGKVVSTDKTELIKFLCEVVESDDFQANIKGSVPVVAAVDENDDLPY